MFEQDYVMRLIREMVRAILKLLFRIDTEAPTTQLLEDTEAKEAAEALLRKIEVGRINEAENELYDLLEERTMEHLMVGLIFYARLNEMEEGELAANDFSREEVRDGVKRLASEFGVEGMTEVFALD